MQKIGKYTINGEIGKGGMGIVYRGSDPYIGRLFGQIASALDHAHWQGIIHGDTGRPLPGASLYGILAMDSR